MSVAAVSSLDASGKMTPTAYLILESGVVFEGRFFGAQGEAVGELVFNTSMGGYLETLTDPSCYGQIILQSFPLQGNYGVIPADFEGGSAGPRAFIAKYPCPAPSNFRSEGGLDSFMKERGIVGLCGIDTRALTKIIRNNGAMKAKIMASPPVDSDRIEAQSHSISNAIASVSPRSASVYGDGQRRVAMLDFGAKRGILEALAARGCKVWSFPHDAPAMDILRIDPHGIMLPGGPGDPSDIANNMIIETIRGLDARGLPMFGVCLGHLLLAIAKGYPIQKLKFGHRGANQPVKELSTGRVYITSQSHGHVVSDADSSFINVNDGTCEGIDYGLSFSVQFRPEARAGPMDTSFMFDRFIERMDAHAPR